jgi:hypothetical protein
MSDTDAAAVTHQHEIPITIENHHVKAPKTPMTGEELRHLVQPPIPENLDLYLEQPGRGKDPLIGDREELNLKPGMHFYTAPKTVNPGFVADAVA